MYRGGNRASAQAPGHSGADRSVSLAAVEGQVLMYCHAGEDTADVLAAVGLTLADLFDEPKKELTYTYPDGRRVHRTPDKQFRQSGNTKGRSLYRADTLTADAGKKVYVTEGEKDALALESVGGTAVCPAMGAGKAHLFDWEPLRGRDVVVVADDDEPGLKHAAQVVEQLDGIAASTVVVKAAVGKDAADHVAAGKSLEELVPIDLLPAKGYTAACTGGGPNGAPEPANVEDEKAPRRSQAAQLVDMARAHYRLGVTDTDDPFGVTEEHPHIAMMLRGGKTGLRAELARRHFAETNTVASQQALSDACMVLEGFAAQEPPQRVYLRVAELGGAVYIDMGDPSCRVIEVSHGKWCIVDSAPVLFRRTKLTGELPHPHPGDGRLLWDFIGIAPDDRPILLAVLVAALIQVDVPHVILVLLAEQGSAKSTITRFIVSLIDPSAVPLRQPPRDPDGWTTAAAASWAVALDNLSGEIPGWLSDCLCRASTGDGSVKRALYTDSDVSVMAFRRCPIINGVDIVVDRGDLAERVATVGLPRVTERRPEDELAAEWEAARPVVFGSLLDLAAKVHHRLPAIEVDNLPRMADFAKVLAAVDEVLGTTGLARYRDQSRRAARDTLDVAFISELVAAGRDFKDATSADLLADLTPATEGWRAPKGWPKSARAVTGLLTRHAPAMRAQGWQVDSDEARNKECVTKWTITAPREPEKGGNPAPPDRPALSAQVNGTKQGRLEGRAEQEAGQAITGQHAPNLPKPANTEPLTSENRSAGQAGQENPPSQVLCLAGAHRGPVHPGSGKCDWCG